MGRPREEDSGVGTPPSTSINSQHSRLGFSIRRESQSWHASDTGALTSPGYPPTQDSSLPSPSKPGDSYLTGLGRQLRTVHASVISEASQAALRAWAGLTRRLPLRARDCRHREGTQASFLLCSGRGRMGPVCASLGPRPSVQAWPSRGSHRGWGSPRTAS